jgi:hypothetical protein
LRPAAAIVAEVQWGRFGIMSPGRSRPLPPPGEDEAKKIPDCETLVCRKSEKVISFFLSMLERFLIAVP